VVLQKRNSSRIIQTFLDTVRKTKGTANGDMR
jgi:hypothetical protein